MTLMYSRRIGARDAIQEKPVTRVMEKFWLPIKHESFFAEKDKRHERKVMAQQREAMRIYDSLRPEWNEAFYGTVREGKRKAQAKRREFGFIPLNEFFPESNGHHVDKVFVIYIPTEMHIYNRHSVINDTGMNAINTQAFNWLDAEEMYNNYTPAQKGKER